MDPFPSFVKTMLAKIYLGIGTGLCVMFLTGAISGWKFSTLSTKTTVFLNRTTGGSWGIGK